MTFAASLRRELSHRAEKYARANQLQHCLSYGESSTVCFERYADDALCHCTNRGQAERLKVALTQRLADCGLEVHPQKTHIVYCKDSLRRGPYPEYQLDFLGFTLRPRNPKSALDGTSRTSPQPSVPEPRKPCGKL